MKAFTETKQHSSSEHILTLPDLNREFILHKDTSNHSLEVWKVWKRFIQLIQINNVETSYFTQLKMCYLMTTFRRPSDILIVYSSTEHVTGKSPGPMCDVIKMSTLSLGNKFSVV